MTTGRDLQEQIPYELAAGQCACGVFAWPRAGFAKMRNAHCPNEGHRLTHTVLRTMTARPPRATSPWFRAHRAPGGYTTVAPARAPQYAHRADFPRQRERDGGYWFQVAHLEGEGVVRQYAPCDADAPTWLVRLPPVPVLPARCPGCGDGITADSDTAYQPTPSAPVWCSSECHSTDATS